MNVEDVTPAIFLRNEAYWVYYVVRDLLKVFGRLVVLDTGSDDSTPDLIRMAAEEIGGTLTMRLERYGNDSRLIGNAPNVLRQMVGTEWMLLCGGDESRNVEDVDGQLVERDRFSADRLIGRGVAWNGDYPFESHGLERRIRAGEVHYLDGNAAYYWHVRHLERSPQDWVTFYRDRKQNFFPWNGDRVPLPDTWLGEVRDDIPNPYLIPTPAGG
jgi:hypothetical protein